MNIVQWPSPLFGYPQGKHGRNGQRIRGIVYHTMDGYWPYYKRIIAGEVGIQNSANYSLGRDGVIRQHVADSDAAWCNGPIDKPDLSIPFIKYCVNNRVNPNLVTISIECEGRSGELWPDVQVAALIEWSKGMMRLHPQILSTRLYHVRHHQIYYPKSCPGPSFPQTRLMAGIQEGDVTDKQMASIVKCTAEVDGANRRLLAAIEDLERVNGESLLSLELKSLRSTFHDFGVAYPRQNVGLP